MTNHPAPLPVIASTDIEYCDECFIPSDEWPSGLVSVHREAAIGGCDFRACPDCAPAVIRGIDILIRNGGSYATKMYYWFKGSDHAV